MALRLPTFSMLLIVFLLPLFGTKLVAENGPLVPPSCTGNPSLLIGGLDFRSALKADASFGFHIAASELNVLLDSINAAKITGIYIHQFFASMQDNLINEYPKIQLVNMMHYIISIAVQELIKSSMAISEGTKLMLADLRKVEKSLQIALKIAAKLNVDIVWMHANNDTSMLLNNLIKQFINLTNLSVKIIANIEANGKISL